MLQCTCFLQFRTSHKTGKGQLLRNKFEISLEHNFAEGIFFYNNLEPSKLLISKI